MKTILLSILLLVFLPVKLEPIVIKLDSQPELFSIDKLGNCYVYQNYQLKKFSAKGKLVAMFSWLEAGKLESIDVSDPMHLLLYYKNFNQLLFLDSQLNKKGRPIYLDELDLNSVSAVCKSKQMAIWIYDDYENKLIHYGFNPKGIIQTINLDFFNNELSDINYMQEQGNELYLNQKNKAVWVFDQFGSKLNKLNIKTKNGFQIKNDNLIFNNGTNLYSINILSKEKSSTKITGFEKFDDIKLSNNQIYVLNNDSITIQDSPKLEINK